MIYHHHLGVFFEASAEITTERVLVREMPILFSPVTEKRLILNFNTKHPEWPLLIISEEGQLHAESGLRAVSALVIEFLRK